MEEIEVVVKASMRMRREDLDTLSKAYSFDEFCKKKKKKSTRIWTVTRGVCRSKEIIF